MQHVLSSSLACWDHQDLLPPRFSHGNPVRASLNSSQGTGPFLCVWHVVMTHLHVCQCNPKPRLGAAVSHVLSKASVLACFHCYMRLLSASESSRPCRAVVACFDQWIMYAFHKTGCPGRKCHRWWLLQGQGWQGCLLPWANVSKLSRSSFVLA